MWPFSWVLRSTTRQQQSAIIVSSIIILAVVAILVRVDIDLIVSGWKFFVERGPGVGATPEG